jgi:hypothetical protein
LDADLGLQGARDAFSVDRGNEPERRATRPANRTSGVTAALMVLEMELDFGGLQAADDGQRALHVGSRETSLAAGKRLLRRKANGR